MRRLWSWSVLTVVLLLASPGAAEASCAGPPEDSPDAFVGTVLSVEKDGRVALVVRNGSRVVVHGSPSLGDNTATSVDRRFAEGGRYEFHPTNHKSPFQDNACTATHQLAGPTPAPPEPSRDGLPGWLPVDEPAGPVGYALVAGTAAGLFTLAFGAVRFVRRRRTGGAAAHRPHVAPPA